MYPQALCHCTLARIYQPLPLLKMPVLEFYGIIAFWFAAFQRIAHSLHLGHVLGEKLSLSVTDAFGSAKWSLSIH